MFWVHDKFGNMLDNPDGSGRPNYVTGLVRPNDPPDDLEAWRPILHDCAVKFVNMARSNLSRSLA